LSFICFALSQQDVSPKESNRLVAKRSMFTCEPLDLYLQMAVVSRISSGCLQSLRDGKALISRSFLCRCKKLCGDVGSRLLVLFCDFIVNGNYGSVKPNSLLTISEPLLASAEDVHFTRAVPCFQLEWHVWGSVSDRF